MFISYSPVLREQYETEHMFVDALASAQKIVVDLIRQERDKRLSSSDWTQFDNAPLTTELKSAWAIYRQALRDITQTTMNWESEFVIDDSYFPAKPETA